MDNLSSTTTVGGAIGIDRTAPASTVATVLTTSCAALATTVAIVLNSIVIVAILRSQTQRLQLTNFFVVNLSVVGLVAATIAMPLSTASYREMAQSPPTTTTTPTSVSGSTAVHGNVTDVNGTATATAVQFGGFPILRIVTTFVAIASVLSTMAISVERCFSIRYPMLHAAHLTVSRTLGAICYIWIQAGLVAVTPTAAGWNVMVYRGLMADEVDRSCSSTWPIVFVVAVFCLTFIVPSVIMAISYFVIFHVARQTARQISPSWPSTMTPSNSKPTPQTSADDIDLSCPSLDVDRGRDRCRREGRPQNGGSMPVDVVPSIEDSFSRSPITLSSITESEAVVDGAESVACFDGGTGREAMTFAANECIVEHATSTSLSSCEVRFPGLVDVESPPDDALPSTDCRCNGAATPPHGCAPPDLDGSEKTMSTKIPDVCIVVVQTESCDEIDATAASTMTAASVTTPQFEAVRVACNEVPLSLLDVPSTVPSRTVTPSVYRSSLTTSNSTTSIHKRSGGTSGGDITGCKAAATLIIVVLAFVPLWTPFFSIAVYRTVSFDCSASCRDSSTSQSGQRNVDADVLDRIEAIFVWCGFVTF